VPASSAGAGCGTLNERILGRGWELIRPIEAAYERGDIDAAEWHARIGGIFGPAYLAATDLCAQSGCSGSADDWECAPLHFHGREPRRHFSGRWLRQRALDGIDEWPSGSSKADEPLAARKVLWPTTL
jgi:hypothetical protein